MYKKDEGILSWKMILKKICKSLIPKYVYENCKMEKNEVFIWPQYSSANFV